MQLFHLVHNILDVLYERIPLADEIMKDEAIRHELETLTKKYASLSKGGSIDYIDVTTHFAYYYRYVTAHAFTAYALFRDTKGLGNLFNRSKLNVSCLGGGPGSDILGTLRYLSKNQKATTVQCCIYDRQEKWRESLGTVCNLLTSFDIIPRFRKMDITNTTSWTEHTEEFLQSDLFTMSYLLSEVYSYRREAEDFFKFLFQNARRHTWFLYIDNCSCDSSEWLDTMVREYNRQGNSSFLSCVSKSNRHGFQLDNEKETDLGRYYNKFGELRPKSSAPIDFRIYYKE